ncbi:DUF1295 domain-containing protein [Okibacterium endophyticum]
MDPLIVCVWVFGGISALTWLLSIITGEYSWVDRIWSIAPIAYVWIFAAAAGFSDARLILMAVLVTLWGARLTFNYARKGGYAPGGQDYRWPILKSKMKPWQFQVFNLFFISIYQNLIILLMTFPAVTAYLNPSPLGAADILLAVLFLGALAGETVADQQQWAFHRHKARERAAGRMPATGFVQTGLFRYSRHPNFFFEQAQWWIFYGFAIAATGVVVHWTVLGAVLLTLLFIGSTMFTESITRSRYPEYDDYRRRTSPIVPWPPRAQGVSEVASS